MTETSVVFETATLADVLKKAEICAPKMSASDHAFGSAAGIMIDITPGEPEPIRVRSTNLEVFYDEWVDSIDITGPATSWRIPVSKFTGVIAALPIGTGKTVTLTSEGGFLNLVSGRTKGKVMLISTEGYEHWEPYDDTDSVVVSGLGTRLAQVAWACGDDRDGEPLTGIYFGGDYLLATNRRRAAMVPCSIPSLVGQPVTVPAKFLTPILRHAGDVRVGIEGHMLTISPDEHTQIRCRVYGRNIPTPTFVSNTYDTCITIGKTQLVDTVQRMLNITKGTKDSVPIIKMLLGGGMMSLRVEGTAGEEWVEDMIDLGGQADHFPILLTFLPKTFIEAVNKAPDEKLLLSYNSGPGGKNPIVRVDGGGDYMAWFVQWKHTQEVNDGAGG